MSLLTKSHFRYLLHGMLIFIFVFSSIGAGFLPTEISNPEIGDIYPANTSDIQDFDLLIDQNGWILLNQNLYWTKDIGKTWNEIIHLRENKSQVYDVSFINPQNGWLLWNKNSVDDSQELLISNTTDQGKNWVDSNVSTFYSTDPEAHLEKATMFWLDENNGWISIKRKSSSNFSIGFLFHTNDGGTTWTKSSLPIAGPVYFSTQKIGWIAGGAGGDEFFRTLDGGKTWEQQSIDLSSRSDLQSIQYFLPTFTNTEIGMVPIRKDDGTGNWLEIYTTEDGGFSWNLSNYLFQEYNKSAGNSPSIEMINQNNLIINNPNNKQLAWINGIEVLTIDMSIDATSEIEKMIMTNKDMGWVEIRTRNCTHVPEKMRRPYSKEPQDCVIETRLITTNNGGKSWEPIKLPGIEATQISHSYDIPDIVHFSGMESLSNEVRIAAQGFDSCVPATVSQMQDWWNNSPYYVWNLYTGGANRGCNAANQAALTGSFVSQLRQQGWYFIPTWVGLQASCSSGNFYKMSSNASTAYNQGVNEANSASDAVANLGFSGSIIYFDLEAYNMADATCVNAARSFISGWTHQLHVRGNLSGLYAMAYEIINYSTMTDIPDGVWMAGGGTNYPSYNPNATVWGNRYASDSLWSKTQRIYQYSTSHNETHGSTSLTIDSDVINGIVAVPGSFSNCPGPTQTSPSDSFVSSNQTVNFTWSAPTGCSYNGYTIQIKDIPDMETGGTIILNNSTNLPSQSMTLDSQWNYKDLYWGVRTQFPFSPNWSVRKFRIEPGIGCTSTTNQIAFFANTDFGGECVIKTIGSFPNPTLMEIANDSISSVKIGELVKLTLCQDVDFTGICETFIGDDSNLADNAIGNDQTSSAKVELRPPPVIIFEDGNFGGASCSLPGSGWMNSCAGMDDQASSIQVLPGWSARVWAGGNLGGSSRCITSDIFNFSGFTFNENEIGDLNDSISSFAAFNQTACKPLLSISKAGNGKGSVISSPVGINCGTNCAASFDNYLTIILTGTSSTGSIFTGWSGEGCSGIGTCVVTMTTAKSITANFNLNTFSLDVSKTGSGTISSSPVGINCGTDCSEIFSYGNHVTLTATPAPGWMISSWGGRCLGVTGNTCTIAIDENKFVSIYFTPIKYALSIIKNGTGDGKVTSSPAGINCGATCTYGYLQDTVVTLTGTPASSKSRFSGWSGEGCSGTGTCQVTMSAARSVTASFELAVFDDVPFGYTQTLGGVVYNLYPYIQSLWDNGFTNGIWIEKDGSGNITYALYGPTNNLNRGMVAKFLLNVVHGRDYTVPPLPATPMFTLDDWTNPDIAWARPWAEELLAEALTNGCYINPDTGARAYCPTNISTRAEAAKFGLTMKYGTSYLPPAASGTVFADMKLPLLGTDPPAHWAIGWAEKAYADGLLPACGTDIPSGKPLYCPDDPINRAWSAYLIVKANGLALP